MSCNLSYTISTVSDLTFEWDGQKAASNLAKHGVSFPLAALVFTDPARLTAPDLRCDYGEDRFIVLGQVAGRVMVVAATRRGSPPVIRLISARKANDRERKRYERGKVQN